MSHHGNDRISVHKDTGSSRVQEHQSVLFMRSTGNLCRYGQVLSNAHAFDATNDRANRRGNSLRCYFLLKLWFGECFQYSRARHSGSPRYTGTRSGDLIWLTNFLSVLSSATESLSTQIPPSLLAIRNGRSKCIA